MSRGRKPSSKGNARICANTILDIFNAKDTFKNEQAWLYNLNYFGIAMRDHVQYCNDNNIPITNPYLTRINKAEAILKQYCDNKDCSYPNSGGGQ